MDARHIKVTIDLAELARRLAKMAERQKTMTEIKVTVGSIQTDASGVSVRDTRRAVHFTGEKLGSYTEPGTGRDGRPTDTRGTIETLYRDQGERLIVHVEDWSHWQGEPTTYRLHEVTEADLSGRGQFARLGQECGYGRPLTLEEALTPLDPEERAYLADLEEDRLESLRASYAGAVELDE